jgi:hypothetical protein
MPRRERQWRLSELHPLDLESLRAGSLERARSDLRAGKMPSAHIDIYPDRRRPVLGDGRHRVLVAMRSGWDEYPVLVTEYGPRGGKVHSYVSILQLDALP